MHLLDLVNRKAVGIGFAVYLALLALGLVIVGLDPSDTELQLVFWPALAAGLAVSWIVVMRRPPPGADK